VEVSSQLRHLTRCLPHRNGIFAALATCLVGCSPSVWAQISPCDLNQDGVVNNADVTLAVNMALGTTTCAANLEGPLSCTVVTVQRVINASLGQTCITYNSHAVILNWTASTSTVAGYDVYRGAVSGGPYTVINSSLIVGTTYTDTTIQAGQTYYYVATAVNAGGTQSAYSSPPVQATIPTP
jgi:hypothetical protein